MIRRITVAVGLIACFSFSLYTPRTDASDGIGIYARIDKLVFEPNAGAPERIQIWGAFALASKQDRNGYDAPMRGYPYYSINQDKKEVCRKEWADLKALAGTDRIIGFGGRYQTNCRVRKADDKATEPDVYPVGYGLVKMSQRGTEYPPIHELRALPKEPK